MSRILVILLTGSLLLTGSVAAVDGLECVFSVRQYDHDNGKDVLLYSDTARLVKGISAIGFLVAFSLDMEIAAVDSSGTTFMVHVVTLGQPASNYSRSFRVEYGLPARLKGIQGKGSAEYSLEILPLRRLDIDTTFCGYTHSSDEDFRFDPSAHLDIYFVPNTYGDYYWNSVKGLMEEVYRRFKELNRFTLPGKYALYLCPCAIHSVIWDRRFGMMVDPTRSAMFAVYSKSYNSTHPFLILQASILRNYGYAPAFLSEGYAGYLSLAIYEMKKLHRTGKTLPLDTFLDSYQYYQADPTLADKTSATFVRYLVDQYKIDSFLELYRIADDLNLRTSIERVYGKGIAELEREWLNYIDTVTITSRQLRYYADEAETLLEYDLLAEYSRELLPLAESRTDSITALSYLVRAMFFNGDYYAATGFQEQLLSVDSTRGSTWMSLGSYKMMNSYYEDARADLLKAKSLDSSNQLIDFNIALNHHFRGETQQAKDILIGIITFPTPEGPQVESRIILANLLLKSKSEAERSQARDYYKEAIDMLDRTVHSHTPSASQQMWNGIAHLGLGDTGMAGDYLQTAWYLETRPFYLGMINLWLGKLADVRGEREAARQYYGTVLSSPSADYHQQEAQEYLKTPYTP